MCNRQSPTRMLRSRYPLNKRYPIYGRLAWLDEVRLIAIFMMILDHALFFFASEEVWAATIRMTLTRCAEPLFVFVFTYLAIYLGHSMRPKRWFGGGDYVHVYVLDAVAIPRESNR